MKIKTTIRGGAADLKAVVAVVNPRRLCPTTTINRPILTNAVLLA
ncbi:MAG TPA: hypothetical protein VER96_39725 [Polyangiaceae bacterium]|nr:hypothetical protein [Polyangiaceae bacterium]